MKHRIEPMGSISVATIKNGKLHRHVITPDDDISGESEEVQALARKTWTPEVLAAWRQHKAAPPPPTLAEAKTNKRHEIDSGFERHVSVIKRPYPEGERDTWPAQLLEAQSYKRDPTSPTPLLASMAVERNMTVEQLAERVLAKYAEFRNVVGPAVGRRHALLAQVEAAESVEAVETIVVSWPG